MNKLLILAYADEAYESFVLPYIYYGLENNPDALIEIILDNYALYIKKYQDAINCLNKIYPNKFLIRQADYKQKDIFPNTIRFIETPQLIAEYVYIGDIDLLIFENLYSVHLKYINEFNLPFSNIIREKKTEKEEDRLTGLHFCKYSNYYPVPNLDDLDLKTMNDEKVLFYIMKKKGLMVPKSFRYRPECGIHISLSRDPLGRYSLGKVIDFTERSIGWGGHIYYKKFLSSLSDANYILLSKYFDVSYKYLVLVIESIAKNNFRELQTVSLKYGFDKRFIVSNEKINYLKMKEQRTIEINEGNLDIAMSITKRMILLWSNDPSLYLDLAWLALQNKNIRLARESFNFVASCPKGREILKNSKFFIKNIDKLNYLKYKKEFNNNFIEVLKDFDIF